MAKPKGRVTGNVTGFLTAQFISEPTPLVARLYRLKHKAQIH